MSGHGSKGGEPRVSPPRSKRESLPLWVWLDAAPAAWLVLLISAYALLAYVDMVPTKRPVPGIPEADQLALPFLVLTVSAGIIRYICLRVRDRIAQRNPGKPALGHRDNA